MKPVDELAQPVTNQGLAFWQDKAKSAALPHVDLIDPGALKGLLPHIVLIDVIWADGQAGDDNPPVDFSYRLVGAHSAETHDANLTGTKVSELSKFGKSYSETMMSFYSKICARKAPVAAGGPLAIIGKGYREFEGIYLPFTETGSRVDRLMAVVVYL
ncbi:MAG: PAS domain-containing protein [Candidatus Phaeomarinobacter sp.]